MHPSCQQLMRDFVEKYLSPLRELKHPLTVIDIGSYNVNGTFKSQFNEENWKYIGIDIRKGENVDIVLEDPYKYPFDNSSIDVIISGNTFEHIEYPWKAFEEINRVIKPGGLICIIVPSFGGKHEEFDAWRILPDGMESLCKWSNLSVIETFISQRDTWWLDCVLVATKKNRKKGK